MTEVVTLAAPTKLTPREKFVFALKDQTIVDKRALTSIPEGELGGFLAEIYAEKKPVVFVETPRAVYSPKRLYEALDLGSDDVPVLLEFNGVVLAEEEIALVRAYNLLKKNINEQILAKVTILPYEFGEVPTGWNIDTRLQITSQLVRRAAGAGERYTGYSIGLKAAQTLWDTFKDVWAKNKLPEGVAVTIRASNENVRCCLKNDGKTIEVGCQDVHRYEVEAVALKMNWDFPEQSNVLGLD